jgi:hypothetical protein
MIAQVAELQSGNRADSQQSKAKNGTFDSTGCRDFQEFLAGGFDLILERKRRTQAEAYATWREGDSQEWLCHW